jgi:hypothetical protein
VETFITRFVFVPLSFVVQIRTLTLLLLLQPPSGGSPCGRMGVQIGLP